MSERPAPVCSTATSWAPGTAAFRDATSDWGLDAEDTNVEGTRLSVTDIDGDGWPDLVVRRGGSRSDDFGHQGVRHNWVLRNTGHGTFEDATESSGLMKRRVRGPLGRPVDVIVSADVDNDGDLDIFASVNRGADDAGQSTSEIFLNDGRGHFAPTSEDSAVRQLAVDEVPGGASFLDYDLDGNVDLWVATSKQDHLFRGDGTGAFTLVTHDVGLTTVPWDSPALINEARGHTNAWSAAACDLNGDGLPELLASSYGRSPNHLWQAKRRADGSVSYVRRSIESGYAFDGDFSWKDNQFARCYCKDHREAEGCADVPLPQRDCSREYWDHDRDREIFRSGGNSGASVCSDIDNDGALDLLTSEIKHWWAGKGSDEAELLINTGEDDVRFERPGRERYGMTIEHADTPWDEGIMSATTFDFDNDGRVDVYLGASDYPGNRGLLFHQTRTMTFTPVPVAEGIDHNRSHGVAVADFDRDGDLDIVVGHSRSRCNAQKPNDCYPTQQIRLFENIIGERGNWLQLRLEGAPGTNRAAIGARVTVKTESGTQLQEVGGGYGHFGAQNDQVLHFGLGSTCEANVTIAWPNGKLDQEEHTLPAGHRYEIKQGRGPRTSPRAVQPSAILRQ